MISIIIPTLNEEKTILNTIERVQHIDGDREIIVVDGGSEDRTVEIASKHVTVYTSKKGRGNQMNCGAHYASGDIVWFLHSDSRIETDSLCAIENAITAGAVGGCFSLYFYDDTTFFLKWLSWSSNLRAKYLKLMFGDQGIFVKKDVFEALGGYKDIPIMEDWDLSQRLHNSGKISLLKNRIGTSARRFSSGGQVRTLLKMHKIKYKYLRGVSPENLIKDYKEIR